MASIKEQFRQIKPANFFFLTIAGIINAVGVTLFLAPEAVNLYDSGFSGTSILLGNLTENVGMNMSIWLIILNVPFFLLGLKKMGVPFIAYSLYTIGVYSLFSWCFQTGFHIVFPDGGSPIAGSDKLLCAIFGGLISGIGSGTTIRFGGAIDGVEVMAVMFSKRIGMTVGTFVMSYNVIFYIVAGVVTQSWEAPLYSVIAYAVGLKAVDFMVDGFDKAKTAFIITDKYDEMASLLSEEFGRGVTKMDAEGYYSKQPKTVLYCVVNRFEVNKLKQIVTSVDPNAFMVINDVTDSLGSSLKFGKRKAVVERRKKRGEKLEEMKERIFEGEGKDVNSDMDDSPAAHNEGKDEGGKNNAE